MDFLASLVSSLKKVTIEKIIQLILAISLIASAFISLNMISPFTFFSITGKPHRFYPPSSCIIMFSIAFFLPFLSRIQRIAKGRLE